MIQAQDFSLLEKRTFTHKSGATLPYRILYPENYDPAKKYPLVLFLHGAGERGNDNEKQLVHGVKTFLTPENRGNYPCILIAPQCAEESYWGSVKVDRTGFPRVFDFNYDYSITEDLTLAIALTKYILKNEGVDKKRVYITGLSMGGMGTFEAVYRAPKLFAAAAPVCGGGDISAYGKKQAKIPFWIFHGDADVVVEVKHSREMKEGLKDLGANVTYTEYPGVNHNSWDNAFADPKLLEWMFGHSR